MTLSSWFSISADLPATLDLYGRQAGNLRLKSHAVREGVEVESNRRSRGCRLRAGCRRFERRGVGLVQERAAMHTRYPHGAGKVGAHDKTSGVPVTNFKRSNRLYYLNRGLDRDKDGIACEKR